MNCPHPAKGRKGLCGGQLRLGAVNRRPGWTTYICATCERESERNNSKKGAPNV